MVKLLISSYLEFKKKILSILSINFKGFIKFKYYIIKLSNLIIEGINSSSATISYYYKNNLVNNIFFYKYFIINCLLNYN